MSHLEMTANEHTLSFSHIYLDFSSIYYLLKRSPPSHVFTVEYLFCCYGY